MGVSFKIARMGTRYRSRLAQIQDEDDDNESVDSQPSVNQGNFSGVGHKISDLSNVLAKTGLHSASYDIEASFSLNLFPDGFSIGKVSESFSNAPEQLYPYNRASEMLFSRQLNTVGCLEIHLMTYPLSMSMDLFYVIQDYRNCLSHEGGIGSIQKSPTVNRVILRMSMENVVKDILSISDDSWTYKNILEVESCILNALQPNLCLSPQPLLGKHRREPLAKKVNLDISWSWKKRDQLSAPATNQVFSNSCHVNVMPGQNSNFLDGLVHQDRQVVCAKENIPTPILNQESNTLQEMKSHSYPLTSLPNCHLGETRDLSTLAELTTSNVSVSKRSSIKRTSDQTKLTSSNLNVKVRCQKQAIQGPPLKKPKKEPVDYSYQQFPQKSIETSAPTQLWWQNTMRHQQIEAEKALSERFQDKGCSSQLIKNGLPSNLEGIMYSQVGSVTSKVKLEPEENCFPNLDFENMKDNYFVKDRRVNSSDGVHFQDQQSLQLVKTNNPIVNTLQKPLMQPIEKSLRKGHVTSRRKVLEKRQLIYDGSTPASSQNVDSFQIEASTPSKRKATPLKGFSINLVDSRANKNNANIATANRLSEGIQILPQTSEIEGDAILERLLKIKEVTQRYYHT
ncbi:Spt20 transcription factor [Trema orientale]|uniref:Spt20 transcription factor n=1 Tax=Trema orientale TaxID=63057 RepID=A0A2P5ENH2_TREOI|nr:Spt20 transcription factor [Trema orientale]